MASWLYADYTTKSTAALQLSALKSHIVEVRQRIAGFQSQSASGISGTYHNLQAYLTELNEKELPKYEAQARGLSGMFARGIPR